MVFGLSSFTALGENKVTRALITMSYWLSLVATPVSMAGLAETIVVFLKIDPAIAAHTGTCPASGISSSSGAINLHSNCQVAGDINLSGTASLTMTDAVLTVQGNIVLNDQAVLMVMNGGLTIPQTDYFQNWINLNNNSQMIIKKSSFVTNATSNKSLGMFLKAYDSSVLTFEESTLLTRGSWLITHFYNQAKLTVNNSLNLPTELYPFDSSQISVSNSEFASLWLDFVPGSIGTVNVPQGDAQGKFDFDYGNSPGFDYSIHIGASHARLGLSSHPNSSMTVNGNGAAGTNDIGLAFAYGVYNNTSPVTIDGLNVGSDVTRQFSDSGRTLSLNHVNLNPFSWQVYVRQSNGYPVTVTRSKINEVGALANGLVNVSNSVLQLAVLEAEGPGSRVIVSGTRIWSQAIIAQNGGRVSITNSQIHGNHISAVGSGSSIGMSNVGENRNASVSFSCAPAPGTRYPPNTNGVPLCNPFNPLGQCSQVSTQGGGVVTGKPACN